MDQQKLINHFRENHKQHNFYQALRILTENAPNKFQLKSDLSPLFPASEVNNVIHNDDIIEVFLSFFCLPRELNNINTQLYLSLYQSWDKKYLETNKNKSLIELTNNQLSKLITTIKQCIGNASITIEKFILKPIIINPSTLGKNITLGDNSKIGNFVYSKTQNIIIYIYSTATIKPNQLQKIIKDNLPLSINFEVILTYRNPNLFRLDGSWSLGKPNTVIKSQDELYDTKILTRAKTLFESMLSFSYDSHNLR
ncbi:MAG: hypothetical protein JXR42_04200 [Gammaproteobacteria bacterium]|nr:hypothetical protein [Gammaproteobacteria bacterium]